MKDPNEFPAGTYVVLLSTCSGKDSEWKNTLPVKHIYKLREDSHTYRFSVEKAFNPDGYVTKYRSHSFPWEFDNYYDGADRWSSTRNHNPHMYGHLKLRMASAREIAAYELEGGPINIKRATLKITPNHRLEVKVKTKSEYTNDKNTKKAVRVLQEVQ